MLLGTKAVLTKKMIMSSQQKAKRSRSLSELSEVGLNIRAMGRIERVKQMPHDQRLFHNKFSSSIIPIL